MKIRDAEELRRVTKSAFYAVRSLPVLTKSLLKKAHSN